MNKSIIGFLIVGSFMASHGQTVDALKKEVSKLKSETVKLKDENLFLKQKTDFCNSLSKEQTYELVPFSDLYDIKVLSCKGNRVNQNVIVELLVSHKTVNQSLECHHSELTAVDNIAKSHGISDVKIGDSGSGSSDIFTDVPIRMKFVVNSIMPGTEFFKIISVKMKTVNLGEYSTDWGLTQIKNLKIDW